METEIQKIKSFVKKHKKIVIPVGIIVLLIVAISAYVSPSYQLNNYSGVTRGTYYGGSPQVMYDMAEEMAMGVSSKMIAPDMPWPDDGVVAYDEDAERQIIKTGNLSLVVKDMEQTQGEIEAITEKYGGFVQHKSFSENEYQNYHNEYRDVRSVVDRSGYYELKIPAEKFTVAYEELKTVALKILNDSISGQDVTEEMMDLETRIANKKAEEEQYREILKKAYKVEDVLEVTRYINETRLEIERLEGRQNYLQNQVSLATVRVNLTAEKDVEIFGVVWSPWQEIKAGFQSFLQDMADFVDDVIAFIFKLPGMLLYVLVWLLGLWILWKILLKIKKKVWKKKNKNVESNQM